MPLTAYPALLHHGFWFEDIASPAVFARDPHFAWGFHRHRLALYRATERHAGSQILRDWAAPMTSTPCSAPGPSIDDPWPAAGFAPQLDDARCRLLGELARPNILMFGDYH